MKNKLLRLILGDMLIAVCIVVLYSPGLLGLRPWDASILRAGFSIIFGVLLVAAAVKVNVLDLKEKKLLDIPTEEMDAEGCKNLIQSMIRRGSFSEKLLRIAVRQIERTERYKTAVPAVLEARFPKGSLSYDKFMSVIDASIGTVVENCKMVAYRAGLTDTDEYRDIEVLMESGRYLRDDIPDDVQVEKYNIYKKNKEEIRELTDANEKLLLKLEKLSVEISDIAVSDTEETNSAILGEIEELINETRYYRR